MMSEINIFEHDTICIIFRKIGGRKMTRAEMAVNNKMNGMNCAQAVASAFSDYAGVTEDNILAMTQALGVGIGATMEGTCGALTGASMILGLAGKEESRAENMKKAGSLIRKFKEQNSSVTCKELKGIETGVMLRSCNDCVKDAAEMLESILENNGD